MAVQTGGNISKSTAYAVTAPPAGASTAKALAYAVVSTESNVSLSKSVLYAVLLEPDHGDIMPTILNVPNFSRSVPSGMTFSLQPNSMSSESPLNGAGQTAELPGARWMASFSWQNLTDADSRVLKAWLGKLRGMAGRFYLFDYTHPTPSGSALGSPTVYGANQTGRTLVTSGWTPNQTALLLPGDYIGVNGQLLMITEQAHSDSSGIATLTFEPPLRRSPSIRTLGDETVLNGGFATDTGWTKGTGWTISGGVAVGISSTGEVYEYILTPGRTYEITYTVVSITSGSLVLSVGGTVGTTRTTTGTYTETLTCGANVWLSFQSSPTFSGTIDNVSAKEVIAADTPIVTDRPTCTMRLKDDNQDRFNFQERNVTSIQIDCQEMF